VDAGVDMSRQGIAFTQGHDVANALMVADLVRAIEQKGKPCCDENDGRWTIEMAHGVYHAQQSGDRVSFPLRSRKHPLDTDKG
jgi:hypothetical protein